MKRWISISTAIICSGLLACGAEDGTALQKTNTSAMNTEVSTSEAGTTAALQSETTVSVQSSTTEQQTTTASAETTVSTTCTEQTSTYIEDPPFTTKYVEPVNMGIPGSQLAGLWYPMQDLQKERQEESRLLSVNQDGTYQYTDDSGKHKGNVILDYELEDCEGTSFVTYSYTFRNADGSSLKAYTRATAPEMDFYLYNENGDIIYMREFAADFLQSIAGEWVEMSSNTSVRNILTLKKDGTFMTDGAKGKRQTDSGKVLLQHVTNEENTVTLWAEITDENGYYFGNINATPGEQVKSIFIGQIGNKQFIRKEDADAMLELAGDWTEQGGNNLVLSIDADGSYSTTINGELHNGWYRVEEATTSDGKRKNIFALYDIGEPFLRFSVPEETSYQDLYSDQDKTIHYVRTGTPFRKPET